MWLGLFTLLYIAEEAFKGKDAFAQIFMRGTMGRASIAYPKQLATVGSVRVTRVVVKPSPVEGVSASRFARYMERLANSPDDAHGDGWRVGAYGLRAPALVDAGVGENLRREDFKGRKAWVCDFVEPFTLAGLLASRRVQDEVLCSLTVGHVADARQRCGRFLGQKTPYGVVTLSGVLALYVRGGPKGAVGWLSREGERDKFPHTTTAFKRCNGVF